MTALLLMLFCTLAASPLRADTEIKVGIYALAPSQGSPYRASNTPSIYINAAIYDALVEIAPGGVPQPALAIRWEQTAPNLWQFHLRPGVTFANGEPLTASAVAASYRWLMEPDHQVNAAAVLLRNVAALEVVDDLTLQIRTREPSATLVNDLAGIYIVPPKAFAESGETTFATHPIGTGPFVVTEWARGRVTLVANRKSWRVPKIDRLRFIEIPDEAARNAGLMSGAVDMAIQVSPDTFADIEAAGGKVLQTPSASVYAIQLVTEKANSPFKDVRVRQAANYAVNKEAIAAVLYHGHTIASGQPAARIVGGYDPQIPPYPYDPARAKALLSEAGYAKGFRLIIDVTTSALPADSAMFSAVARDLSQVGIETELRSSPLSQWFQKYAAGSFEGLAFQLGFIAQPQMDTVRALEPFSCGKRSPPIYTCVRAVEAQIDLVRKELDSTKRAQALRDLNRIAHDQAIGLFLVDGIDFTGLSSRIRQADAPTRFFHWDKFERTP